MAVGKTTLGRNVAERLRMPFLDLDERIERRSERSVASLFEDEGEQEFRRIEAEVLAELLASEPASVVATGGGTFTLERNRQLMADAGTTVWLDAPFESLLARVDTAKRPMWAETDAARELAHSRKKYYGLATFHLELGDDSVTNNTERLYRLLARHRNA